MGLKINTLLTLYVSIFMYLYIFKTFYTVILSNYNSNYNKNQIITYKYKNFLTIRLFIF